MDFRLYLKKHSPTILTYAGAAGVVATAVASAKAAPKAKAIIEKAKEDKGEELTKLETIRVAAPVYFPAVLIGASTIACVLGANVLNQRTQASLMSAYALVDNSYKEYKNKLKELYGEEAHDKIVESIAIDKANDVGITAGCFTQGCSLSSGEEGEPCLFYDEYANRYFESTIERVIEAEYHLNRNFVLRGHAYLNEFYEFLGLDTTDFGDVAGWAVNDDMIYWIDFNHRKVLLDDENLECYILEVMYEPTTDFLDW